MISDRFEIFLVNDFVSKKNTLYHTHDYFEIHCTLSGEGIFYIDGKEYTLYPGTVTLVSNNDLHRIVNQSSEFFERLYIFINPNYLQRISTPQTDLTKLFLFLGKTQQRFLNMPIENLKKILLPLEKQPGNNFGDDLNFELHLINFLIEINKFRLLDDSTDTINYVENDFISKIIIYINDHLNEQLTLDSLSDIFFTDKYHILREFKKKIGITPHQFILKKRLMYSKELLRKHESSANIYSSCGFNSYTHFLSAFKKEFHITPKEFIKKSKENSRVNFHHYEI